MYESLENARHVTFSLFDTVIVRGYGRLKPCVAYLLSSKRKELFSAASAGAPAATLVPGEVVVVRYAWPASSAAAAQVHIF
jgi:hypothetical protein